MKVAIFLIFEETYYGSWPYKSDSFIILTFLMKITPKKGFKRNPFINGFIYMNISCNLLVIFTIGCNYVYGTKKYAG